MSHNTKSSTRTKAAMNDKALKTMRHSGGWAIALGSVAVAVGVSVGVGCIVMGAKLLKNAR